MKDKLKVSLKDAMKSKDKIRLNTIRSLLSAIQYEEMQQSKESLSETESIAILRSEIKKRKESIEFAEKANRAEEVESLQQEIAILESFLPAQLSESELTEVIKGFQAEESDLTMGQAMKLLKERHSGQYDGKMASEVAKRMLA